MFKGIVDRKLFRRGDHFIYVDSPVIDLYEGTRMTDISETPRLPLRNILTKEQINLILLMPFNLIILLSINKYLIFEYFKSISIQGGGWRKTSLNIFAIGARD